MKVKHSLDPIYDANSKVLILGSIPSVKSRQVGFYYMHPKNRFWKTLEKVYCEEIGESIEDKKIFLYNHHIALFDVVKSCDIISSSDSTIKNIVPNNLSKILKLSEIKRIFVTGKKALELYNKYIFCKTKIEAIYLPSTSPANCPRGIEEKLIDSYSILRKYTDD